MPKNFSTEINNEYQTFLTDHPILNVNKESIENDLLK